MPQRLKAGEQFAPSARQWNRFVDASDKVLGFEDATGKRSKWRTNSNVLTVKNDSDSQINAYEPAIITGVVFAHDEEDEATSSDKFNFEWMITVKRPADITDAEWKASYHWHGFVIAQDNIVDGELGPAMISGITPFKITSSSGSALSAETHLRWANDLESLEADNHGVAQILYMRPGAATGWGLIQFPVTECKLYSGTLTEDIGNTTANEASCTLKYGDAAESFGSVTVQAQDTLSIFSSLNSGADVLLLQSGSDFRIIQAGC